jgi:hypothetical protein
MADDTFRVDDVDVGRHLGCVRLRGEMGEDSERIVLARRKRGLAANNEVYLLLVNNDLFDAPSVSFSRNWVEI